MVFEFITNVEVFTEFNTNDKPIVDSAKINNGFIRVAVTSGSGFIPVMSEPVKEKKQIGNGTKT